MVKFLVYQASGQTPGQCRIERNGQLVDGRAEETWDRFVKIKLSSGSIIFVTDHVKYDGTSFRSSAAGVALVAPVRISLSALSLLASGGLATPEELGGYRDGVVPGQAPAAKAVPASDMELLTRAMIKGCEVTPIHEVPSKLDELFGKKPALTSFTVRTMGGAVKFVLEVANGLPVLTPEARKALQEEVTV